RNRVREALEAVQILHSHLSVCRRARGMISAWSLQRGRARREWRGTHVAIEVVFGTVTAVGCHASRGVFNRCYENRIELDCRYFHVAAVRAHSRPRAFRHGDREPQLREPRWAAAERAGCRGGGGSLLSRARRGLRPG